MIIVMIMLIHIMITAMTARRGQDDRSAGWGPGPPVPHWPGAPAAFGGAQTGSYQTGSYQKGRFIPPKPNTLYFVFFDTTPFICL